MTGKLDWEKILAMFTLGGYNNDAVLSDSTALLALTGLTLMQEPWLWQDYTEDDDIQAAIALAIDEIVNTTAGAGDMIKIASSVYTSDIAEPYIDNFDSGTWLTMLLIASGLLSDYAGNWCDSLEIEHNDHADNADYTSFCHFAYNGTTAQAQWILNNPGNIVYFGLAASGGLAGVSSQLELTLYDPLSSGYRGATFKATVPSKTSNNVALVTGTHGIFIGEAADKILLRPLNGTTFLVGGENEPPELRMTLYGLQ